MKILLGSKRKVKYCGSKRRIVEKEDTMVYVPILNTLQKMISNVSVRNEVTELHDACYD